MQRRDVMGAVADIAAGQHGAFTRRQAADHGLSRRQIQLIAAEPAIAEPVRGVLVFRGAPRTWHQEISVATLVSPGFHAGMRAAGFLHRIDGVRTPQRPEILGRRGSRAVRGLGLEQHWVEPLDPGDIVVVDGISCTGLARTVIDLCGLGDRDLAIRAVDDFERRGMSLNWLRLTADRLHRPGQSGTGVVRSLLDRRQAGGRVPDSWFERLVERCVTLPGLPPWESQYVVRDGDHFAGRLDLACPALMLGVEAHSREFHFGQRAEAFDQRRDNRASGAGWHIVYVGWYDAAGDPAVVAAMIEKIARRRAEMLRVELPWAARATACLRPGEVLLKRAGCDAVSTALLVDGV